MGTVTFAQQLNAASLQHPAGALANHAATCRVVRLDFAASGCQIPTIDVNIVAAAS
jgi:hypothetical protein